MPKLFFNAVLSFQSRGPYPLPQHAAQSLIQALSHLEGGLSHIPRQRGSNKPLKRGSYLHVLRDSNNRSSDCIRDQARFCPKQGKALSALVAGSSQTVLVPGSCGRRHLCVAASPVAAGRHSRLSQPGGEGHGGAQLPRQLQSAPRHFKVKAGLPGPGQ